MSHFTVGLGSPYTTQFRMIELFTITCGLLVVLVAPSMYVGTENADTMYKGTDSTDTMYKDTESADTMYKGTESADTTYEGTGSAADWG